MWLRFSASSGMFSTARWSAMKKASNARAPASGQSAPDDQVEVGVGQGARIAPRARVDRGGRMKAASLRWRLGMATFIRG